MSRIVLTANGAMWHYANRSSAFALNRNHVYVVLLFTGEYELVRPVLCLCEMENFCAYLNPAYLHYNASETTVTAVQETHHCPANGGVRVWIRGRACE